MHAYALFPAGQHQLGSTACGAHGATQRILEDIDAERASPCMYSLGAARIAPHLLNAPEQNHGNVQLLR
jgi:hypothetical protein